MVAFYAITVQFQTEEMRKQFPYSMKETDICVHSLLSFCLICGCVQLPPSTAISFIPLPPTDLLFISIILSLRECSAGGIIEYVTLGHWLF